MRLSAGLFLMLAWRVAAETGAASGPQAVTVTLYDQGFALVQELRRVTLHAGENDVLLAGLPRTMDPATTAFTVTAGVKPLDLLEQTFTAGGSNAVPTLRWVLKAGGEGIANLKLSYRADACGWTAAHELVLDEAGTVGRFSTRVALRNASGRAFDDAHLRLVLTERGLAPKLGLEAGSSAQSPQRFAYGQGEATAERLVAGLTALQTYEVPASLTLPDGVTKYVVLAASERLFVRRLFVYDGVRFDRFQRNRRTDWSYGTEQQNVVDAHVEFDNDSASGLGQSLPPGRLRILQRRAGDVLDFLGEADLAPLATNASVRARIGPARGLHGERERVGYTEVKPLHEYEESFEIRLKNESEDNVVVRVVEHLYRAEDFEIVKADAEYRKTDPQVIEFSPELKAGGQRSIHYTVRYRW